MMLKEFGLEPVSNPGWSDSTATTINRIHAAITDLVPGVSREHLSEHLAALGRIGDTGWVLELPTSEVASILAPALREECRQQELELTTCCPA